ncbi:MAG: NADH-quinone oxidoreductase subunit NuoK [Bacillota bacterium]|nr:NADH-quinone oxidoreductase subunit NuoK [Bacillota bacterium]
MSPPLHHYLILAAVLFCLGLYGVLAKRNAIVALMSVELMLAGVNLNLVAFDRYLGSRYLGQVFALFTVSVAAAEAAVGLALVIALARRRNSVDLSEFTDLSG